MERPPYESNMNMKSDIIKAQATEIFEKVDQHLEIMGIEKMLRKPSKSCHHHFSQVDSEGVQQHLISSVIFRRIRQSQEDIWELENIWDSVKVSQLDDIRRAENFEYLVNYLNDTKTAMVKSINVVLRRTILDWSREDGNVLSMQIVWTGSFMECQRVVELFDQHNNDTTSVQLRIEEFSLHPHLRRQFISHHQINPTAASIAAIHSSPSVIIHQKLLDKSDDEGILCAICHDKIGIGFPARQLPCKHLFHASCIMAWFFQQFNCPLCRDEFK